MTPLEYIDGLDAHMDEGGPVSPQNVRDLMGFVRELSGGSAVITAAIAWNRATGAPDLGKREDDLHDAVDAYNAAMKQPALKEGE